MVGQVDADDAPALPAELVEPFQDLREVRLGVLQDRQSLDPVASKTLASAALRAIGTRNPGDVGPVPRTGSEAASAPGGETVRDNLSSAEISFPSDCFVHRPIFFIGLLPHPPLF